MKEIMEEYAGVVAGGMAVALILGMAFEGSRALSAGVPFCPGNMLKDKNLGNTYQEYVRRQQLGIC